MIIIRISRVKIYGGTWYLPYSSEYCLSKNPYAGGSIYGTARGVCNHFKNN